MTNITSLFDNAETHTVSIKDLCIEPKMQMRVEMNHDHIEHLAIDIQDILKRNPIKVVAVTTAVRDIWYIVDGFHRYHAAIAAGMDTADILLVHSDYDTAIQYAMSENFRGNLSPTEEDSARAIAALLESAPDFGYVSRSVTTWLRTFGIAKRTADRHTEELRAQIDEMRDAKIEDMLNDGESARSVAKALGCSRTPIDKIQKKLKEQSGTSEPVAQKSHPEDDVENDNDELDFICDVTDEDVTKAREKAEALSEITRQQEEARKLLKDRIASNVTSGGNDIEIDEVAAEKAQGMAEALARFLQANPRARTPELNKVLNGLVGA